MASSQSQVQKLIQADMQQRLQDDSKLMSLSASSSSSSSGVSASDVNPEEQKQQILATLIHEQRQKLVQDAKNELITFTPKTPTGITYSNIIENAFNKTSGHSDVQWATFMKSIQKTLNEVSNVIISTGSFGTDVRRESLQVFKSASTFLMMVEYKQALEQALNTMEREIVTPLVLKNSLLSSQHIVKTQDTVKQQPASEGNDFRMHQLEAELQKITLKANARKEKLKKLEQANLEQSQELLPLRERVSNLQTQLAKAEQREEQTNTNLRMSLAVAVDETKIDPQLQNYRRDSLAKFARNVPVGGPSISNTLFIAQQKKSADTTESSSSSSSSDARIVTEERLKKYCTGPRGQVLTALGRAIQENNLAVVPYFNLVRDNPASLMSTLNHIQDLSQVLSSAQSSVIMGLIADETQDMVNALYNTLKPQMKALGLANESDLNRFLSKKVDEFAKRISIEDKLSSAPQRALS